MAVETRISDTLLKLSEKGVQEVSEIIGTIINKQVTVSFQEVEEFNFSDIQQGYTESVLMISCNLNTDPEGVIMAFVEKPLGIKISSWMIMSEPGEEFTDEHLDSMKEITNQISGALVPIVREESQTNIEFQNIDGKVLDLTEDIFGYPDLITAKYNVEIEGEDPSVIHTVLTTSTVESLIPEGAAEEEAPAEPAAEAEEEVPAEEGAEALEGMEEAAPEESVEGFEDVTGEPGEGEEAAPEEPGGEEEGAGEGGMGDFDLEGMLGEAQDAVEDISTPGEASEEMDIVTEQTPVEGAVPDKLELLLDLSFPVSIELGRTKMLIKDVLELGHGSVIEFDKLAGEPVDLLINDKKIAEGEVVVIDEHFGIRITNLVEPSERLNKLN